MRLQDYLERERLTLAQFAERIERSVGTVSKLTRGELTPSKDTAERVFHATGGLVTPNDLFDLPPHAAAEEAAE